MLVNSRDVFSHQCYGHPEDNLKFYSENEGVHYKHGFTATELINVYLLKSPLLIFSCLY